MSDLIETRLNDTPYSANSCTWLIANARYEGITDLNYEQKRERKLVYGSRKDGTPLGLTGGKYGVGALGITMLRSSYQRLIEQLTILGLGSYGDAVFPIVATYSEVAAQLAGVPPVVVVIEGVRITGEKDGRAEGIDELVTEVELMALRLTKNGLRLWSVVNGV